MENMLIKRKNVCINSTIYPIEVTHVGCQTIDYNIEEQGELPQVSFFIGDVLADFVEKFNTLYKEYFYSLPNSLLMYDIFAKRYEFTSKFHEPSYMVESSITDLSLISERCINKIYESTINISLTKNDIYKIWGQMPYINYGFIYHEDANKLTWFYNISR